MQHPSTQVLITLLVSLFGCLPLSADFSFDSAGARIAFDNEGSINVRSYEVIAMVETPWEWDLSDDIELEIALEGSLGAIDGESKTAAMLHLGFAAIVEFDDFPVELVVSSGPTFLTEDKFRTFDLGSKFQFTSAVGLDWELVDDWKLGYRYLHISNAGLGDPNPGLNMHAVSLLYSF